MYIACKEGFFALAKKPVSLLPQYKSVIHIRAHSKEDLERLVLVMGPLKLKIPPRIFGREVVGWRYRIFVHPSDLPKVLGRLGPGVNYKSFKKLIFQSRCQKQKFWAYDRLTQEIDKAYGIPTPKKG